VQSTGRAPSVSVELRSREQETDGVRAGDWIQPASNSMTRTRRKFGMPSHEKNKRIQEEMTEFVIIVIK